MKNAHALGIVVSSLALIGGCGGADAPDGTHAGDAAGPSVTTGKFEIPPGDSFTCFYTDTVTTEELSVSGASGQQGPGGHHILIYWTDTKRDPQHHECNDQEMIGWHQIAGSAGKDATGAEGIVTLPENLAIKVPAGKQLVLQSHYINTTGKAMTVEDHLTLDTLDPKDVKAYANYFVLVDDQFQVPPDAPVEHSSICTVKQDLNAILMLGHMHEYGTHYRLETIDDQGASIETLYDQAWEPLYTSHPPITRWSYDQPRVLTKGTRIRQTCDWANTTTQPLVFPREMCIGFFYYYPDEGELQCDMEFPQ